MILRVRFEPTNGAAANAVFTRFRRPQLEETLAGDPGHRAQLSDTHRHPLNKSTIGRVHQRPVTAATLN